MYMWVYLHNCKCAGDAQHPERGGDTAGAAQEVPDLQQGEGAPQAQPDGPGQGGQALLGAAPRIHGELVIH